MARAEKLRALISKRVDSYTEVKLHTQKTLEFHFGEKIEML
jgi:hypothetical protein